MEDDDDDEDEDDDEEKGLSEGLGHQGLCITQTKREQKKSLDNLLIKSFGRFTSSFFFFDKIYY